MDMKRVKQILSSPQEITVHYNGVSVWIDSYDEQGNTATVHMRGNEKERYTVPVEALQEV
ncbi:small acid-soluble spore protein H (minor) [Thermolongibacillus altinsuensis]|jgi:small acid-soluble spore protein H (minor)|uniref:Small acid-soluble spore protein H (Minor) n=1 Tax=Thermolongibacillus altinsuensis TaxID=575256 RepID=A0A4R1QCZ8_9BACL|nr:H-type small acid-soluble spore protein [Thermolongibacillus altinsuensis]TCL47299.1 small acid-soluble spore protein H (minor) [Thermolongibacillus altinsuensis]GMB08983.1 small, acid-soluble spore protein H 1 [Thermolongibacillus altinsuensis]